LFFIPVSNAHLLISSHYLSEEELDQIDAGFHGMISSHYFFLLSICLLTGFFLVSLFHISFLFDCLHFSHLLESGFFIRSNEVISVAGTGTGCQDAQPAIFIGMKEISFVKKAGLTIAVIDRSTFALKELHQFETRQEELIVPFLRSCTNQTILVVSRCVVITHSTLSFFSSLAAMFGNL
jgi:hypothetical protein